MRLTRAQNILRLAVNVQNRVDFWGSAPAPAEGAYDAPSDSLVVRGFLPSAIAASGLRRLQFPVFGGGNCFHHSGGIDATASRYTFSRYFECIVKGGMRAVIWTDVFQFLTMVGGMLA